jgi:DNA-binding transcriptional MerR regulator
LVEFRVEELAERAAISVELLRSYQSRGLLPRPRHEGRVAYYGQRHLDRLLWIRDMKERGHSLRIIEEVTRNEDGHDLTSLIPEAEGDEEMLTLVEVAERTRVPPAVLRSFEASGVLRPRRFGNELRYTGTDVRAVRMLLGLLGWGLPMEEFMRVARMQLDTAQDVAKGAVELFMRYGREPLRHAGLPQREEAERMVGALRLMMHAATALMTYNFQRMVLAEAQDVIEREGSRSERAALQREIARRRIELPLPA